jgi:quercetin dioxygenase-like cupin family protein
MLIRSYEDVEPVAYGDGIEKRVVIGAREGAPTFVMRVFDVASGKSTPYHSHDWEHEGLVLAGEGTVLSENGKCRLKPGDVFFIAPNEKHCLVAGGESSLRFMCLVPLCGEDAN